MSTAISILKARVANWREWEPNPVLLKELRQSVRSRALAGALLTLLAALFLAAVAFLMERDFSPEENPQVGLTILRAFLVILTVATVVFVPLQVAIRLAAERQESNLDLMFITALSPTQIIRGKWLCGAYVAALLFSVSLPFMTFTHLLGGVDLPTIVFVLICLYSAVGLAIQAAILIACLPFHRIFKAAVGLLFTMGLLGMSGALIAFFFGMLRSSIGALMAAPNSWVGFISVIILVLLGTRLLYGMSVALIMADNRPRGYFNEVIREGEQ